MKLLKPPIGKRYYAKVYELMSSRAPYNDPKTALKKAVSSLNRSATVN